MRYRDLRDKPIHLMSDEEFEYVVDQLLNAKVITNEDLPGSHSKVLWR